MRTDREFEKIFQIMGNEHFLAMEGLSNEVPFFVHAYDIQKQEEVYTGISDLCNRLWVERGISTLLIGLYDMVLEYFNRENELEDVFQLEREVSKKEFLGELQSMINPEHVVIPYFKQKLKEDEYQILIVFQIGEVFPYLRTHNILNQLQSTVTTIPLVVFFPGEYIMSKELGFHLNLFGKFPGPYYRAFRLDDYLVRGNFS